MPRGGEAEERDRTHRSLVLIGEEAVMVIEDFFVDNEMTLSLRNELLEIVTEIKGVKKNESVDD